MQNKKVTVIQDPEAVIPAEVLAKAIVDISESIKKIEKSRLNRRAIVALVKDDTGISMAVTDRVLNSLRNLGDTYCK